MKTLADIKLHLLGNCTTRINGTTDSGEVIRIILEQYLNTDREQGRFDVIFYEESGEKSRLKSITFDELQEILDNYTWQVDPQDIAVWNFLRNIKQWVEVSKEVYWDMLECVPPVYHRSGVFACGEAYTHNDKGEPVYSFFKEDADGKFWTQLMSKQEYLASK